MHSTGSFLNTVIERVRGYLDEPSSKYSNDFLMRNVVMPEMVNVLSRLSLNFDNPIVIRQAITIASGTEYYQLPPNVGEIFMLVQLDENNIVTADYKPQGQHHPTGPNWSIEGNLLSVRPLPDKAINLVMFYIPNGDFLPHYATDGAMASDGKSLTLSASPTLGALDTRPGAYAGATLRILKQGSNTMLQERIIDSHTAYNTGPGLVKTRVAFDAPYNGTLSSVNYEIVPQGFQSLMQCVSAASAINLAVMKDVSAKKMQFLQIEYRKALKTIGDNLSYMQMRKPKSYQKLTMDNQDRHIYTLGSERM